MVSFTEPSDGPWRLTDDKILDPNGELLATIHANHVDGMVLRLSREMYAALEEIAWNPSPDAEGLQNAARNVLAKR
jgi:hypothetical protein